MFHKSNTCIITAKNVLLNISGSVFVVHRSFMWFLSLKWRHSSLFIAAHRETENFAMIYTLYIAAAGQRTMHGFDTELIGNPATWLVEWRNYVQLLLFTYRCRITHYGTVGEREMYSLLGLISLFTFISNRRVSTRASLVFIIVHLFTYQSISR